MGNFSQEVNAMRFISYVLAFEAGFAFVLIDNELVSSLGSENERVR